MARTCEITGKGLMSGHNVSHSNRRTKRFFFPNLQNVTLRSDFLNKIFRMKICVETLRSIDANGGLDSYLLSTSSLKLTNTAKQIKKDILQAKSKLQSQ